jgi:putative MATE family efflux protein
MPQAEGHLAKIWAERRSGRFLGALLALALPIALQNVLSASLNFIDNVMVGQLGAVEIASVGLANQVYFIVFIFLGGVSGGASMFISQYWGKRDLVAVRRIHGLSLILVFAACAIVVTPSVLCPALLLGLFTDDPAVIALGASFLRISSPSYLLYGISIVYSVNLRNTGRPKVPLLANATAVAVNTALNYCLIFGRFGLPRLGVPGSGLATCIARLVELSILLGTVYSHDWPSSARLREMLDFDFALVRKFFSQSGLIIAKDLAWAVGMASYMSIYARLGTTQVAAMNILSPVTQLAVVFFTAIAASCQIMVGNKLGQGDREAAYLYAGRFMKMVFAGGLGMGCLILLARGAILAPYNIPGDTRFAALRLIADYGMLFPLIIFNMISVVGVMRAGGDTIICLVMDTIAVYGIGLPLALLGAFVWRLPIYYLYPLIYTQELFKAILMLARYRSRKWMRNLTA